jgi:pyruvate dehydrogenase E1 component alpha subunit
LKDPLARVEKFLRHSGVTEAYFIDLAEREEAFAVTVREQCRALEAYDLSTVFDQTYAEPHPVMLAEKAAYLARARQAVA